MLFIVFFFHQPKTCSNWTYTKTFCIFLCTVCIFGGGFVSPTSFCISDSDTCIKTLCYFCRTGSFISWNYHTIHLCTTKVYTFSRSTCKFQWFCVLSGSPFLSPSTSFLCRAYRLLCCQRLSHTTCRLSTMPNLPTTCSFGEWSEMVWCRQFYRNSLNKILGKTT